MSMMIATGRQQSASAATTLLSVLTRLNLTANLANCFDFGSSKTTPLSQDIAIYNENAATDIFYLGATGAGGATAPVFSGTAGSASSNEFFTLNGSQSFRFRGAQPTWANNIHKAGGKWSVVHGTYCVVDATNQQAFIGDTGNAGAAGFQYQITTAQKQRFYVSSLSAGDVLTKDADAAVNTAAWNFLGISIDGSGGAGTGFLYKNGGYDQTSSADTFDATYTLPSALAAAQLIELYNAGNNSLPMSNGSKTMFMAIFSTNITKANMDSIYASMRGRLGI